MHRVLKTGLLTLLSSAVVLGTLADPAGAASTTFSFSYTFTHIGGQRVLAGSLYGEIQPDGDTVFIDGFGPVTFGGVLLPSIEPSDIRSISDFNYGLLQPLVSFSASRMDVFVCAQGFIDGNCDAATTGGFFLNTAPTAAPRAGAGDGQGVFDEWYGTFDVASWVLVPEPSVVLLVAFGLLAVAKRRLT